MTGLFTSTNQLPASIRDWNGIVTHSRLQVCLRDAHAFESSARHVLAAWHSFILQLDAPVLNPMLLTKYFIEFYLSITSYFDCFNLLHQQSIAKTENVENVIADFIAYSGITLDARQQDVMLRVYAELSENNFQFLSQILQRGAAHKNTRLSPQRNAQRQHIRDLYYHFFNRQRSVADSWDNIAPWISVAMGMLPLAQEQCTLGSYYERITGNSQQSQEPHFGLCSIMLQTIIYYHHKKIDTKQQYRRYQKQLMRCYHPDNLLTRLEPVLHQLSMYMVVHPRETLRYHAHAKVAQALEYCFDHMFHRYSKVAPLNSYLNLTKLIFELAQMEPEFANLKQDLTHGLPWLMGMEHFSSSEFSEYCDSLVRQKEVLVIARYQSQKNQSFHQSNYSKMLVMLPQKVNAYAKHMQANQQLNTNWLSRFISWLVSKIRPCCYYEDFIRSNQTMTI